MTFTCITSYTHRVVQRVLSSMNTFIAQLQHISPLHSEQYLNDRDPPQSVRQAPGREHYQSQQGPTTAGLPTARKQSQDTPKELTEAMKKDYVYMTLVKVIIEDMQVLAKPAPPE